jgi:hypothetical protein
VTNAEVYARMSEIRSTRAAGNMQSRLAKAKEAKDMHNEAAMALEMFMKRGAREAKQLNTLLQKYNRVACSTTSRTLMLLDVTCSMDLLIEKTKSCIGTFFDRCQKVLDSENIHSGFELQIAAFSNYNVCVEEILEASTWEAKPHQLSQFLTRLRVRGGWGPEAVEVGLMHALEEHKKRPLDQIILIGDAPANPLEDIVDKRRHGHGSDSYWDKQQPTWSPTGIPKKEAMAMLQQIQLVKPVPLHAYHMAKRAQQSFENLAACTGGGSAQKLDVNSSKGADDLTDAVCKQILSSLGGKALEDAYERMKPSFSH